MVLDVAGSNPVTRPILKFFFGLPLSGLFSFVKLRRFPAFPLFAPFCVICERRFTALGGTVAVYSKQNAHILLGAEESRKLDALAIEKGVKGSALMEAAGKAVADTVADYIGTPLEAGGTVIVLCGPGNNGGDGFVAARYLDELGYPVSLRCSVLPSALKGDAKGAAGQWRGEVEPLSTTGFSDASAIIDCLLGTGLSKPVEGEFATIIDAVNESGTFVLAADVPSGLCSDTGKPLGACVEAGATVTFMFKKPGHTLVPGRYFCGGNTNVHVVNIGVPEPALAEVTPFTFENIPTLWGQSFPYSGPQTHKYERGHMLVLGGKEPTLGASRLASLAGLRVGAGLVTLAAPTETYPVQASALMDVMVRRFDSAFGFMGIVNDPRIKAVLVGPGAGRGEKTVELVKQVGAKIKSLVLDADALASLVGRSDIINDLKSPELVLTPHEGEFAKLFPSFDFRTDRVAAAKEAARATKSVVVLKGVSTVVAAPDGRASIATNAPSWLSIGGTGDVLSGMICGLITQGMPAFEAASAGVWLHGESGMQAGRGLIASDLLDVIPKVLP